MGNLVFRLISLKHLFETLVRTRLERPGPDLVKVWSNELSDPQSILSATSNPMYLVYLGLLGSLRNHLEPD